MANNKKDDFNQSEYESYDGIVSFCHKLVEEQQYVSELLGFESNEVKALESVIRGIDADINHLENDFNVEAPDTLHSALTELQHMYETLN